MRTVSGSLLSFAVAGALGMALLTGSHGMSAIAAQQAQRPAITATVLIREGDKITLDRGSQHGLRKGDKLQVVHNLNGANVTGGEVQITRLYGTTSEAKVLSQSGVIGPEDIATLETEPAAPTPAASARKAAAEPVRKAPDQPVRKAVEPGPKVSGETARPLAITPARTVDPLLPLLPQFSADAAGGASFAFDFTNEAVNAADTSVYRSTARLIFDNQDYRAVPATATANGELAPGKTRTIAFKLTDFTLATDKNAWPPKSGRHTVLIKFGGKQYGPLTFDWRGADSTQ